MSEADLGLPSLDAVYRRSPRMVARSAGDAQVLVPASGDGGREFVLNPLGVFLWDRLDGASDGQAHVAAISQRFTLEPQQAQEDYLILVLQLLDIGAVEPAAAGR